MQAPFSIPSPAARRPTVPRLARSREISIIIPALNEAKNLMALLSRIDAAMAGRSYEVIIVDDNSRDGTPETCAALAARYPLRLIVRGQPTGGLSGAVLHGMVLARGKVLVVMDADLQHPPEAIPDLLSPLESPDVDFVLGSRYVPGGTTEENWGFLRRINSRLATLLARPFAGKTRDPMSGFFALRARIFRRASGLTPVGYKIALELMCKCRVHNVREVPIHFGNRAAGESKLCFKQQARYLRHLARLYRFRFPRSVLLCSAGIGAAAGWLLAKLTNPAMSAVLTVISSLSFAYVFRGSRVQTIPSRRELTAAERPLRHRIRGPMEQAA